MVCATQLKQGEVGNNKQCYETLQLVHNIENECVINCFSPTVCNISNFAHEHPHPYMQVMYTRNYNCEKVLLTDPTMLKGWQDVFETSNKQEVEDDLRNSRLDFAWQRKDRLRIVNKEAAVETHPETGDKVWFNHSQVRI